MDSSAAGFALGALLVDGLYDSIGVLCLPDDSSPVALEEPGRADFGFSGVDAFTDAGLSVALEAGSCRLIVADCLFATADSLATAEPCVSATGAWLPISASGPSGVGPRYLLRGFHESCRYSPVPSAHQRRVAGIGARQTNH